MSPISTSQSYHKSQQLEKFKTRKKLTINVDVAISVKVKTLETPLVEFVHA